MISRFAKSPLQNCLLLSAILLSILFQFPQPDLDLNYYTLLASDYASSNKKNTDAGAPLHGVKIVITGATSGIGLSLTKMLHNLGGTIIVIGRNTSKLAKLESMLDYGIIDTDADGSTDNTNNNNNKGSKRLHKRIIPILAEFTDMESVSTAADTIRSKFKTIDILINNAGMIYPTSIYPNYFGDDIETSTPQGYDRVFTVNYLAHFLLTEKLLPSLKRSKMRSGARIIQVSSSGHFMVNGEDLGPTTTATIDNDTASSSPLASQPAASYSQAIEAYMNSKLAQIYHMRSLNARESESLDGSNRDTNSKHTTPTVKAVSICPSWVATNIIGPEFKVRPLMDMLAFSPDGFGIASILFAMFHPYAGLEGSDYVDNTNKRWFFIHLPRYVPEGVMDRLQNVGFLVLGLTQKFASGVNFGKSSQDSYDVVKRDALFEWSKVAVEPWLK